MFILHILWVLKSFWSLFNYLSSNSIRTHIAVFKPSFNFQFWFWNIWYFSFSSFFFSFAENGYGMINNISLNVLPIRLQYKILNRKETLTGGNYTFFLTVEHYYLFLYFFNRKIPFDWICDDAIGMYVRWYCVCRMDFREIEYVSSFLTTWSCYFIIIFFFVFIFCFCYIEFLYTFVSIPRVVDFFFNEVFLELSEWKTKEACVYRNDVLHQWHSDLKQST